MRSDRGEIIGYSRNGVGMRTGPVKTYEDVAEWVAAHIAKELNKAGANNCDKNSQEYVLTGKIREFSVDEFAKVSSQLKGEFRLVRKDNEVLFLEDFSVVMKQVSWATSSDAFTDVILSRR